jgi:hypothetical protein
MGVYDYLKVQCPLPGIPDPSAIEFQTKDTDGQYLDHYEIRADGTLWHEAYEPEWRADPSSPIGGYLERKNPHWVEENFTGALEFYTSDPNIDLSFAALFKNGQLVNVIKKE